MQKILSISHNFINNHFKLIHCTHKLYPKHFHCTLRINAFNFIDIVNQSCNQKCDLISICYHRRKKKKEKNICDIKCFQSRSLYIKIGI